MLGLQSLFKRDTQPSSSQQQQPSTARLVDRPYGFAYHQALLPFSTDHLLHAAYQSITGGIRVGKLLADMDAVAATIGYIYCGDPGLTVLTAVVDRVDLVPQDSRGVLLGRPDVRIHGSVTHVGRSSMEVAICIEARKDENGNLPENGSEKGISKSGKSAQNGNSSNDSLLANWELVALAKLLLVVRTPDGSEAVQVGRLIANNAREQAIIDAGAARSEWRR